MTNYLFLFRPDGHPDFDVFYDIFWEFFGEENPLNVQWTGGSYSEDFFECIIPNSNQEKLWESCYPRPFTLGVYFGSLLKLPHKNFAMSCISRTDEDGTIYEMVMAKEIETR